MNEGWSESSVIIKPSLQRAHVSLRPLEYCHMSLVKAEGIVIRAMKMGETSKLVTLFTRESGILKVVAKGSRASKSRFGAALEVLTVVRIVYYDKENRELHFLSQAEIAEHFPNIPVDLARWGLAQACCELTFRTQAGAERKPALYPVLLETLRAMNGTAADARACFFGFQMKLLGILGVAPNLQQCQRCGTADLRPVQEHGGIPVEIRRGGVLCARCGQAADAQGFSGEAFRLLRNFQALPANKLSRYKISSMARREIERFFRAYGEQHAAEIGRLAALKFVHEIDAAK